MHNKSVKQNPGPNVYETPSKAVEGPKFHMGSKYEVGGIFPKSAVPGPGTHNPAPSAVQRRSASFSVKGKYKMGTQMVITPEGNHEKVTPGDDLGVPGPGSYSANCRNNFTSLSTRFGHEKRQSMCAKDAGKKPAPNAYDKDAKRAVLKSAPKFGFGTSKRPASHDTRHIPGPGTY